MSGGNPNDVVIKAKADFSDIFSQIPVLQKALLKMAGKTGLPPQPNVQLKGRRGGFQDVSGVGGFTSFPPGVMQKFAEGMGEVVRQNFEKMLFKGEEAEDPILQQGITVGHEERLQRLREKAQEAEDPILQQGKIVGREERLQRLREKAQEAEDHILQQGKIAGHEERLQRQREKGEIRLGLREKELGREILEPGPPKLIKAPPAIELGREILEPGPPGKEIKAPPAISGQIPKEFRSPLPSLKGFGQGIDAVSKSLLDSIDPNRKVNEQISDAAQVFLAFGGILSPISPALGQMSMQLGFSAFSMKGFGIALGAVTTTIGLGIKALQLWATSTSAWIKQAFEAGNVSSFAAESIRSYKDSLTGLTSALGKESAEAFRGSTMAIANLNKQLASTGGVTIALQREFSELGNGLVTSVVVPVQGVVGLLNSLEENFYAVSGSMAALRDASGQGKLINFFNELNSFINTIEVDSFINGLSKIEQSLLLKGENLQKFAQAQGKAQLSSEKQFKIFQRDLVSATIHTPLTEDEAAKAAAIEKNRLFADSFQPSLVSMMEASSGMVKEVIDPKEPGDAAIQKQLVVLKEIKEELKTIADPDRSIPGMITAGSAVLPHLL